MFLGPREEKLKPNKREKVMKKKEKGWVGIGIGSGKFGENELQKDIKVSYSAHLHQHKYKFLPILIILKSILKPTKTTFLMILSKRFIFDYLLPIPKSQIHTKPYNPKIEKT